MGERKPKVKKNYSKLEDSQFGLLHRIAQRICINLMRLYFIFFRQLRISGKEHRPKGWQSYVVACNHTSTLDPPLVSLALYYQPISFLAKKELFDHFWMRTYNWLMSSISVNRDKMELSTVKSAFKVLATKKWALGLFPEGTRVKEKDGKVGETKRGVAYFAHSAKMPILPLGIVHSTTAKGKKRIDVKIGPLMPHDPNMDLDTLARKIQDTLAELVSEIQQEVQAEL